MNFWAMLVVNLRRVGVIDLEGVLHEFFMLHGFLLKLGGLLQRLDLQITVHNDQKIT